MVSAPPLRTALRSLFQRLRTQTAHRRTVRTDNQTKKQRNKETNKQTNKPQTSNLKPQTSNLKPQTSILKPPGRNNPHHNPNATWPNAIALQTRLCNAKLWDANKKDDEIALHHCKSMWFKKDNDNCFGKHNDKTTRALALIILRCKFGNHATTNSLHPATTVRPEQTFNFPSQCVFKH